MSQSESEERLERYGENEIRSGEAVSWWQLLLQQFTDPLIYLLIVAAIVKKEERRKLIGLSWEGEAPAEPFPSENLTVCGSAGASPSQPDHSSWTACS